MVTEDKVRARLEQIKLDIILSQARLRWLGNVHRMAAELIPLQTVERMPNGRRERCQQRMSWLNTGERDLSSSGSCLGETAQLAKDHHLQRSCIALTNI